MKKRKKLLIVLGLLLIFLPFMTLTYSIYYLISCLVGIIVLLIGLLLNRVNILRLIFYPLIIIALVLTLDYFKTTIFMKEPLIAVKYKSSQSVAIYNSFLYRAYSCEDKIIIDYNYTMPYACKKEDLEVKTINKFLENPSQSYKDYKNKFVYLTGKINTIVGNTQIVLNSYNEEVSLNGYVTFDERKKVIVDKLNINPSKYNIYDYIEVIGLVSNYKVVNDTIEVYLQDAKIIDSDIYKEYELLVNNINNFDKVKAYDNLYYLGISKIYYKYDENNIYELDYLISDKKESVDNLIYGIKPSYIEEKNRLYELEKYNILICENADVVFMNKYFADYLSVCKSIEN